MEEASAEAVGVVVSPPYSEQDGSTKSGVEIDERRLLLKIDLTLIPWLSFLYTLCFLDRVGIGNARLYGMEEELNMSDDQYLIALTILFIPYALLEVPSNLCLKRFRPSVWLSSLITLWGITATCFGLAQNYSTVLALRFMLGIFEAGFPPGVTYLLSSWYRRNEIGLRLAFYMSGMTVAGAFGGLLAAAISNMDGVGGKSAWSWIFIIEGLLTVVAGILSFWIIQDFPATARILTLREREFIVHRLKTDDQLSAREEKLKWKYVKSSFLDDKTWLSCMTLIGYSAPSYAFSFFLPSIINQLGYTATRSNLLTVPVYVVASIIACVVGYAADRLKRRAFFNTGLFALTITGYIVLLCSREPALSYTGTYIVALGIFPGNPNQLAWLSNNVEGGYKRAVSIALSLSCVTLMGIVSSNTYRQHDAPWYSTGHAITLSFVILGLLGSTSTYFLLRRENKLRDRGERDEVIITDGKTNGGDPKNGVYDSVEDAKRDKGDRWSGFRYIL